jgi:hypothetical protein
MTHLSLRFLVFVVVAYGAGGFLHAVLDPIERVLSGPARAELERASVRVVAHIDNVERSVLVKVPIDAIYGLHNVATRRHSELAGYISSEDLPDESTRQPTREVCVDVSVWWNEPALRMVLAAQLREQRNALLHANR